MFRRVSLGSKIAAFVLATVTGLLVCGAGFVMWLLLGAAVGQFGICRGPSVGFALGGLVVPGLAIWAGVRAWRSQMPRRYPTLGGGHREDGAL